MRRKNWILWGAAAVVVAGGYFASRPRKEDVKWRQAGVAKGGLQQRISATGTLSAVVQVNVGTQVSGTIAALYVDYNSEVKKGQTVAVIDPTLLQAAMQDAQAGLERARTGLDDAKRQLDRAKRLSKEKLLADQDLEARQVIHDNAVAGLETAQANLSRARTNLDYATIKAPVAGVVVSRAVDVGQTVAASFNTPTLFTIAQDLTKMKLEASIDEADIGQVRQGQPALFTVDSYPDTQFKGRVNQVRLEPITQQNVVTYKVVVAVSNDDLKLRPGMTANVSILTQAKEDVLKVPSAALRFNPMAFLPTADAAATPKGGGAGKGEKNGEKGEGRREGQGGGRPGGLERPGGTPVKGLVSRREDRVWVLENGRPKALPVKAGITDGQSTEVSGEGLAEGLQILVGIEEPRKAGGPAPLGGAPGGMPRR